MTRWSQDVRKLNIPELTKSVQEIEKQSLVLSRYVSKYFFDISQHLSSVYKALKSGGSIYYIVGNSKFYDTLLPVEKFYADLMDQNLFNNICKNIA